MAIVALFVSSLAVPLVPLSSAQGGLYLEGEIYLWDGTTKLAGLPGEDSTSFAVWVKHGDTWTRYPQSGWMNTSKGWYGCLLPEGDRDINWSSGDEYRIQVDARPLGGVDTNATSHGTGDPGEVSTFGSLNNSLVWNASDVRQRWDIVMPLVDLLPNNISVNGAEYPGPYDLSNPIGPIQAFPGSSSLISANVSNNGTPMIRIPSSIVMEDSCSGSQTTMGHISAIGAFSTAPLGYRLNASWLAPAPPFYGNCFVDVVVDFYDNVTEVNEGNNRARIWFIVGGPDLTPSNITIEIPGNSYYYPDASATIPPFRADIIPVSVDSLVNISINVTNWGNAGTSKKFNITFGNTDGIPGGAVTSVLYNSGDVGPLDPAQNLGVFSSSFVIPNQTGYHCLNLSVDYGLNGSGNVTETFEYNNTFVVCFSVGVPDLTVKNVTIEVVGAGNYSFGDISRYNYTSQPIYVHPGQGIRFSCDAWNVGSFDTPAGIPFQLSYYYIGNRSSGPFLSSVEEWDELPQLLAGEGTGPYSSAVWNLSLLPGSHYVKITIDNGSVIQETNEENNTFVVHFVVGGPDLIPEEVIVRVDSDESTFFYPSVATVHVRLTSEVRINATVLNAGNFGTNSTFDVVFYEDVIPFSSYSPLGPLDANENLSVESNWDNPAVEGIHSLRIVADNNDSVPELNETNNVFLLTIIIEGPDLTIDPLNLSVNGHCSLFNYSESPIGPISINLTDEVFLSARVLNVGDANTSDGFRVAFYRDQGIFYESSMLGPLGPRAHLLVGPLLMQILGQQEDFWVNITVDYDNRIMEVDEDNNTFSILFHVSLPDLLASKVSIDGTTFIAPIQMEAGLTVTLRGLVENLGPGPTGLPFSVAFYNSSDRDHPFFLETVGPLAHGENGSSIANWTSPQVEGQVTVFYEVDYENVIRETNESNNKFKVVFVVYRLWPDLIPNDPRVNDIPYQGVVELEKRQTVFLSVRVENVGGSSTGAAFFVGFFNSTEAQVPFKSIHASELEAGETSGSLQISWTTPVEEGNVTIVVRVDCTNTVSESNEENNTLSLSFFVKSSKEEFNYKPLLALLFLIVILVVSSIVSYFRPLDRVVPPPRKDFHGEAEEWKEGFRSLPLEEKAKFLGMEDMKRKISRDRQFTWSIIGLPYIAIELAIGTLSFLTGFPSVPESGNWLCFGMIVNIVILAAALIASAIVVKLGYNARELRRMKEESGTTL